MTDRPHEFDAALLRHSPLLRSLAKKHIPSGWREDVIQDVQTYALTHWRNFYGAYEYGGGFTTWLRWQFFGVVRNYKTKKRVPLVYGDKADKAFRTAELAATQARTLEARDALGRFTGRGGEVLLRRAAGELLQEIGDSMGISRERVRQIEQEARKRALKVAA